MADRRQTGRRRARRTDSDLPDSYPDPRRRWGKVGTLVVAWVALWGVGALFGTWAFSQASASSTVLDDDPISEQQTAERYLEAALNDRDTERAQSMVCESEFSGLGPADMAAFMDTHEENGVTPRAVPEIKSASSLGDGMRIDYTINLRYGDRQRDTEFQLSIKPDGRTFCVAEVVWLDQPDANSTDDADQSPVTTWETATDFLGQALQDTRDWQAAEDLQCQDHTGLTAEQVTEVLADWEAANDLEAFDAGVHIHAPDVADDATEFTVTTTFSSDSGGLSEDFDFEVEVAEEDGDWCVAQVSSPGPGEGADSESD